MIHELWLWSTPMIISCSNLSIYLNWHEPIQQCASFGCFRQQKVSNFHWHIGPVHQSSSPVSNACKSQLSQVIALGNSCSSQLSFNIELPITAFTFGFQCIVFSSINTSHFLNWYPALFQLVEELSRRLIDTNLGIKKVWELKLCFLMHHDFSVGTTW